MRKIYINFSLIAFVFCILSSCGNPEKAHEDEATVAANRKELLLQRIDSLDKKMKESLQLDMNLAVASMGAYMDFARNYGSDSLAPEYMFKAAEISSAVKMGENAVQLYDNIIQQHPGYKKIAFCYFLKAFTYETQLKNMEKAKAAYEEVIKKFPNDKLAQDARASIEHLGKSDDELIKMFEEKNKKG